MKHLPLKINWRITSKCDMKEECSFCYSPKNINSVNNQDIEKICSEIIRRGVKAIVLTGGEPLSLNITPQIIKRLSNSGVFINVSTNGNLLLDRFNNFYKYIDVLALPLDGDLNTHNKHRYIGNFNKVIDILKFIKQNHIKEKYGIKLKIETVLTNNNKTKLHEIAAFINYYNVDVWKIFEYNFYPNRNNKAEISFNEKEIRNQINDSINTETTEVIIADCKSRNNRYFMINPNGDVVLPTNKGANEFEDIVIGSFLKNTDETIQKWNAEVDKTMYHSHYLEMYDKIYNLNKKKILLKSREDILLWTSIQNVGITRAYKDSSDFSKYRIIDDKPLNSLSDFLSVAKKEVIIVSHGLKDNLANLEEFLMRKFENDSFFIFKLIMPQIGSRTSRTIADSMYSKKYIELKNNIKTAAEMILRVKKKFGNNCSVDIFYTQSYIYGSIIVIDKDIIQIETKYVGVDETKNLILEIRKSDKSNSYFKTQLDGIESIVKNSIKKQRTLKVDSFKLIEILSKGIFKYEKN